MSERYKNTCRYLHFVKHVLILVWAITGCVLISAFSSLLAIHVGVTSSAVRMKIFAVTTGIKNYKSIINKKRKHDEIVLLGNDKLNTIQVLY